MSSSPKETVFISGATGFIALNIIDVLLSKGYKVIGTVRSASKGDILVNNFKIKYPNGELSYELVGDIAAEGAFDEALKKHPEIKYVLHTASPVAIGKGGDVKATFIDPSVDGTVNMLKGIKAKAPQVTRVVLTSSFAALRNMDKDPKEYTHTEESWNPITLEQARVSDMAGYAASKTFAEKLAWKFLEEETPNFSLTTITPPFVLGPQLFADALQNESLNFSAEIINGLLKTTPKDDHNDFKAISGLSVDVRDVALFHVLPLENDNLLGKRLFPAQGKTNQQALLNIINERFPELRGKIAKGNPENASKYNEGGLNYDNSKSLKLVGIEMISPEQTVVDSVKQILDYKKFNL